MEIGSDLDFHKRDQFNSEGKQTRKVPRSIPKSRFQLPRFQAEKAKSLH
ncbi:hypothetical protein AEP_01678 [Curvibacter sp. AEP1-3]|nr:hypothetical protein AEP_01678 [Curvibacter sp. AEP1-3]